MCAQADPCSRLGIGRGRVSPRCPQDVRPAAGVPSPEARIDGHEQDEAPDARVDHSSTRLLTQSGLQAIQAGIDSGEAVPHARLQTVQFRLHRI